MPKHAYVAFDLGAESGRAMLAVVVTDPANPAAGDIELEELHRFPNTMTRLPSGYHWNLVSLWDHLVEGLRRAVKAADLRGLPLVSLGVDTWGVDFGLVGKSGQVLGLPFAYRDARNEPAMRKAFEEVGQKAIYDATGIQFMNFNTLYQLVAQRDSEPATLQAAQRLLHTPDLLHYFFSGVMTHEDTIVSTSQMSDPATGQWDTKLLASLRLPTHFLGQVVPAGTKIGSLRPELAREVGLPDGKTIDVIVPGSHDTASAVAAVPVDVAASRSWAFLSSGTWSLMGAELDAPIVTDASREAGFTNERGVAGKTRFLKNIAGLWLVQEVRRDLAKAGQEMDYETLTAMARQAPAFRTLVDPAHAPFASPGDMRAKITAFAQATGQPVPADAGQFVRCCLDSLALCYRQTMEGLEALLGRRIEVLHIVGGGGRNALLNQLTADALGRPVVVGPFEATATGNALTQAIGAGQVRDLPHLRAIVRASSQLETYQPANAAACEKQLPRYRELLGK